MLRAALLAIVVTGCHPSSGPGSADDDDGPIGNNGDGGTCGAVDMVGTHVAPSIQLLIDGSGTMGDSLGSTSRYNAVKNALVDNTNGLLVHWQTKAAFGASVYTSEQCPAKLYTSAPALSNKDGVASAIDDGQNANHQLDPLFGAIDTLAGGTFGALPGKKVIVIASDGDPNKCDDQNNHISEALDSATAAFANQHIETYIIGLSDDPSDSFLQRMANAGVGSATDVTKYRANSQTDVANDYAAIFDLVIDCSFALDGTIDPAQASLGSVKVNGTPLTYGTDWEAVDATTIRLLDTACSDYKVATTEPAVTATFTCGASH